MDSLAFDTVSGIPKRLRRIMRLQMCTKIAVFALALASVCGAQNAAPAQADGQKPADQTPTPPAPPAPAALPTPAITGPLSGLPPAIFDAGPFGKIAVNGILNGFDMWQGNHVPGDDPAQAAMSNGQIFLQKTDGWFLPAGGRLHSSVPRDAVPRHRQNTDQLLWFGATGLCE